MDLPDDLLLSFDVGTTGLKASLFTPAGELFLSFTQPYATSYPQPGWAEQAPDDWLRALYRAWGKLAARVPTATPERIRAVGLSGHMMGVVAVDAEGEVLRPALIHSDVRSAPKAEELGRRLSPDRYYDITGQPLDPHYPLTKLMWLAAAEPEVYARAHGFLQSKDWVRGRLTDPVGDLDPWNTTDFSDASVYGVYDLAHRQWSAEVIEAAGLASAPLPEIVGAARVLGRLNALWASALSLPEGLPVVAGGGDGSCATAGAGVATPGAAYAYLGGTAWIGALSDGVPLDAERRLFVVGHLDPGIYAAFGTAQTVGSAFEWVAREVFPTADGRPAVWEDVEALAAQAEPGCRGLFFLPYMMGERSPLWDPHARGTWVGLTLGHTRAELARSVYEGAAFALRSILDAVEDAAGPVPELRLIGGGAQSRLWMPILSSTLGKRLVPCSYLSEATSLGAAMAAGVGAGLYRDLAEAARIVVTTDPWEPDAALREAYEQAYAHWSALYPALRTFFAGGTT